MNIRGFGLVGFLVIERTPLSCGGFVGLPLGISGELCFKPDDLSKLPKVR